MNLVDDAVEMCTCLIVNIHHHSAKLCRAGDITLRLDNHKVHVKRLCADTFHRLQHREAKRDVRNKHSVHHITMQPIGLTAVDHIYISLQISEVSCKQRRRNNCFHDALSVLIRHQFIQ